MRNIRLLSLIGLVVVALSGCEESSSPKSDKIETPKNIAEPVSRCQLTMGWDPWEPYQYLTPEDEVKGLEIELVGAIAGEAGCSIEYVQKNWMDLLDDIRKGNIDILGGASQTEAREEFAFFSDNYRHESFILYVRAEEVDQYSGKTLKELLDGGFRLGVTQDYIYGNKVSQLQDNEAFGSQIVSVPTTEVNYYNLLQNNIDGFLEDPFVAAYTIKRKGLLGQIKAHTIEVHSGDVAIMFSKKSVKPEIVTAFNQALAKLKESGKYQEILAKYRY